MTDPLTEAHIYAVERRERNGKWKVRSVQALQEANAESSDEGVRFKHITSATGGDFDEACAAGWRKLQSDPKLRTYLVYTIRYL